MTKPPLRNEPFRDVLVGTDFSTSAEAALRRAAQLVDAESGSLRVVHVLDAAAPPMHRARLREQAERALADACALAREVARAQGAPELHVDAELLEGTPFSEIIRGSRTHGADLVVLGRHGHRAFADAFVGTTAERVVRKGDVPTLVVHDGPVGRYRRPVVAVDLDDASARLFSLARRALGRDGDPVCIVHAYHVPFEPQLGTGNSPEAVAFRREYEEQAREGLAKLVASLPEDPSIHVEAVVRKGDPRLVVLDEAVARGADLIVIGTHARAGLSHVLLGSVAETVLRAAPCDVLVARPTRFSFEMP